MWRHSPFEISCAARAWEEDRTVTVQRAWPAACNCEGCSEANPSHVPADYLLYCTFDAHKGPDAARCAAQAVVPTLESNLHHGSADALQRALVRTLVQLQLKLGCLGRVGGCTAVVALQVGRLLTVATVGAAGVQLDTGWGNPLKLGGQHHISSSASETKRLLQSGVRLAAVDLSGHGPAAAPSRGVGGLRVWPGGLAISRSLGDFEAGPCLLPLPHITQVLLPDTGCRLTIASERAWRPSSSRQLPEHIPALLRSAPLGDCPKLVAEEVARQSGSWAHASVIVADILPVGTGSWEEALAGAAVEAEGAQVQQPWRVLPLRARSLRALSKLGAVKKRRPWLLSCFGGHRSTRSSRGPIPPTAPAQPADPTTLPVAPGLQILAEFDSAALLERGAGRGELPAGFSPEEAQELQRLVDKSYSCYADARSFKGISIAAPGACPGIAPRDTAWQEALPARGGDAGRGSVLEGTAEGAWLSTYGALIGQLLGSRQLSGAQHSLHRRWSSESDAICHSGSRWLGEGAGGAAGLPLTLPEASAAPPATAAAAAAADSTDPDGPLAVDSDVAPVAAAPIQACEALTRGCVDALLAPQRAAYSWLSQASLVHARGLGFGESVSLPAQWGLGQADEVESEEGGSSGSSSPSNASRGGACSGGSGAQPSAKGCTARPTMLHVLAWLDSSQSGQHSPLTPASSCGRGCS